MGNIYVKFKANKVFSDDSYVHWRSTRREEQKIH